MTGLSPRILLGLGRAAMAVRMTGLPPTEANALASRVDTYRACQRTANAFFPGPPRPDPQEPRR